MRYILPGIQLESEYAFDSFRAFEAKSGSELPLCTLVVRYEAYPLCDVLLMTEHKEVHVGTLADGWLYLLANTKQYALHVSRDYRQLTAYITDPGLCPENMVLLVRLALLCAGIGQGVLSLHSSCVELDGQAICFTAPSGTGKSTRAMSWESGLGARIISGDRPSICLGNSGVTVSGVPWDGKEQIFMNVQASLLAIINLRRGDRTYVRRLSRLQARRVLTQQCFIPMWDTDMAAVAIMLVNRLCSAVSVYRVTCGPGENAAKEVRDLVFYHPDKIREIEQDMKIKSGFTLRNMAGEYIVMPTGKNIRQFDGAIVLNDVSAFVWKKLGESCSREELLEAILSEFEVDREQAQKDLDVLLKKLHEYQVIEDESV